MKSIPVQKILNIANPAEFKVHVARWNKVENPLAVYLRDKKEWREWNTYGEKKNAFNRKYIFSLIHFYPERKNKVWLFGGVYEIIGTFMDKKDKGLHRYKIKEVAEYSDFVGRLKVGLPYEARQKSINLETYLDQMSVSEILKEPYSGEVFPGYENIDHSFSVLEIFFKNESLGWKFALENVQGIYVVTDMNNGKKYVGSAYGVGGVWARWSQYIDTGHGGNEELTKLIEKKGFEYAQKHFKFSLLEHRSKSVGKDVMDKREKHWKKVLLSRGEFGYNKN